MHVTLNHICRPVASWRDSAYIRRSKIPFDIPVHLMEAKRAQYSALMGGGGHGHPVPRPLYEHACIHELLIRYHQYYITEDIIDQSTSFGQQTEVSRSKIFFFF